MNKTYGYYWIPNTYDVIIYSEEKARELESSRNITWIAVKDLDELKESFDDYVNLYFDESVL